jgi:hypothetical protein
LVWNSPTVRTGQRFFSSLMRPPVQFAVAVPVRILQGYGRWMEVESDKLKAGTPLVTRGTYLLSNGAAVQVYPKERIVDVPAAQPATKGAKAGAAE